MMTGSRIQLPSTPDYLWLHAPACSGIAGTPSGHQSAAPKICTKPLAPDDALYLNAEIVDQIWDRLVKQQRIINRLKKIVRRQNLIAAEH